MAKQRNPAAVSLGRLGGLAAAGKTRRAKVAYHEAGHAVMAALLGMKLQGDVTIVPNNKAEGSVTLKGRQRTRTAMEKYIMVNMAGCAAQRIWKYQSCRSNDYSSDGRNVAVMLGRLVEFEEEERPYSQVLRIRTRKRLERKWHLVEALAAELQRRGSMSGVETAKFIEEQETEFLDNLVSRTIRRRSHAVRPRGTT